jgi:indolepyruvate ferredoxin oxidoreductase
MAPPLFARRDKVTGHPRKMTFGPWLMPLLRILAKGRRLRGTPFDPFGYTNERRRERRLIEDYERLLDSLPGTLSGLPHCLCRSPATVM